MYIYKYISIIQQFGLPMPFQGNILSKRIKLGEHIWDIPRDAQIYIYVYEQKTKLNV